MAERTDSADMAVVLRGADCAGPVASGVPAALVTHLRSRDGSFEAGFCRMGPEHEDYGARGYDEYEFCQILSGSVTLTEADGRVRVVAAGDALVLPRGWRGRWDSDGYEKYWVIYHARD